MTILKRCTAAVSALVMLLSGAGAYNCYGEENSVDIIDKKEIIIDGTTAQLKENMRYRGAGMVAATIHLGCCLTTRLNTRRLMNRYLSICSAKRVSVSLILKWKWVLI